MPAGETYVAVESPRGEIGCYLVSDGSGKPVRMHIRGPSFYNLQSIDADGAPAASSPTRSRSSRASTRSWARSTAERSFTDANLDARAGDRRAVPATEVGDPAARCTSRRTRTAGSRPRRWRRSPSSPASRRPTCSGRAPSTRCSSGARAGSCVVSVCTNVTLPRDRRPGDPRAPRARATRPTPTSRSKRSSASPRAAARRRCRSTTSSTSSSRPSRRTTIVEEYKRGRAHGAHDLGSARGADAHGREETRIVTKRLHDRPDDSWTIDGALATGAYEALRAVLAKGDPADVQEQVKVSGLRGRGGAGFPTGAEVVVPARRTLFPRYLVVNGDEGEPSTFKDRMLVERDPHQLIEGIVIAAYAIQCNHAFVYLRGEFALGYERLDAGDRRRARARASSARNILGSGFDLEIVVHRGAGAYICGEETGAARVARGRARACRASSRRSPRSQGLYAKPTVVNNVETLSTVPHIIADGRRGVRQARREPLDRHAHLLGLGPRRSSRATTRSSSACTFRDLIYGLAGGVRDGHELKFFIPGGASSQWLIGSDEHLDAPLDMDFVQQNARRRCSGRARSWCSTRPSIRCSSRGGSRSSSRTSRAASARRAARARAGSRRCSTACRTDSAGPTTSTCSSTSAATSRPASSNAPFAQTTICPLGPSVGVAASPASTSSSATRSLERLRARRRSARVTTTEPEAEADARRRP